MPGGNQITLPDSGARSTLRPNAIFAVRWLFPAPDGPLTSIVGERTVLGRGEDCDTVLAGSGISRYHAELMRMGPVAMVRDLDSMNGLFVNGRRVKEAPLEPGDVLRLGEWVGVAVELERGDTAPAVYSTIASGLFGGNLLRAAVEPALRAARSDLPIIVEGETGTGKEVVAHAVHEASGRSGAFLAVNCAALPEQLAEAELFGYRRGAFTGADRASPGHFRSAQHGTLLLDEIIDLTLPLQAKVLRVLEQREVVPLGESQPVPIDVRVIVAAQESLEKAVADRRFRPDLYARLEGLTVRLPPLRDRLDDVPGLFARLLRDVAGGKLPTVEPRLVEALCLYDWPFNVRELVTLVRRMVVLHGHEPQLGRRHLPTRFRVDDASGDPARAGRRGATNTPAPSAAAALSASASDSDGAGKAAARDDEDFARLLVALRSQAGNVSRAAGAIGISRQRAYRLMQAHPEVNLPGLRGTDGKLRGTPGAG
jgi:DNA-binding NtrC family response regulator